jgi:hypothetical protein
MYFQPYDRNGPVISLKLQLSLCVSHDRHDRRAALTGRSN